MKKLSATFMLTAMLVLPASAFATAASAQDAYPPNGVPPTEVQGIVEFPPALAFTGSSSDSTVKLAFGFVLVGAVLVFVAKSRNRDEATA